MARDDGREKLRALVENAWMMSEEEIDSIRPGRIDDAIRLLTPGELEVAPFRDRTRYDLEHPDLHLLKVMRDPAFFPFTCYHLFSKPDGSGPLEILPFQHLVLQELWRRQFPMVVASRGAGKTFLLALYAILRMLFTPGAKVVVVAGSFRQAKNTFDYMERFWYASPVLQDLVGSGRGVKGRESGPRRDIDRCEFLIGDSVCTVLPLGDGSKIRGLRANYIICDEFACLDRGTLVETDRGLERIEDCEGRVGRGLGLQQPDGGLVLPDAFIKTPPTAAYRVVTEGGYEFTCSGIHQVMTTKGWKLGKDLTADDFLPQPAVYRFPAAPVVEAGIEVTEEVAWLLGALLSEGSVSGKHQIAVCTTDLAFAERVRASLEKLSANKVGVCRREAYTDERGWECKASYQVYCCDTGLRDRLERLGLARVTALSKSIPWSVLQSPRPQVLAFLSGLFDGDGSAFLWSSRGRDNHLGVAFYSGSEQLVREVQVVLQKLGLFSYRTPRKSLLSNNPQWMVRLNGQFAHDLAAMLAVPRWAEAVAGACPPAAYSGVTFDRSRGKWIARVTREGRAKHLGRFDSKQDAEGAVRAATGDPHYRVRSVERLPGERRLYDFHVPVTHRFVGNGFVQHNSVPEEIYAVVVQGFGAVTADPVKNVKDHARMRLLKRLGLWTADMDAEEAARNRGNQSVIAGSADYSFKHFCKFWNEYKAILDTGGDRRRLEEVFRGPVPDGFRYQDYSVVRLPYDLIPHGYMDAQTIARAKQISHTSHFGMEYGAVFANDSDGFFKRSLIEKCVAGRPDDPHPPTFPSCGRAEFQAAISGLPGKRYVYGVDPAYAGDKFAVVILEQWPDHRRVVFCWTTGKSDHRAKLKNKTVKEHDFYRYCVRKLRDLMKVFPCDRMLVDAGSGGGGTAILEAFGDPDKLAPGELPVYPAIDPDPAQHKDTDDREGEHLLEMVVFRDNAWVSEANHGMKKDMEDRVLLFPLADPVALGLAMKEDEEAGRVELDEAGAPVLVRADTLEACMLEVEELKNELATIVITATPNGLERWDTPDAKLPGQKKGVMRKDRYSALLMANMGARQLARNPAPEGYPGVMGEAAVPGRRPRGGDGAVLFTGGPAWFQQGLRQCGRNYGGAVPRSGVRS